MGITYNINSKERMKSAMTKHGKSSIKKNFIYQMIYEILVLILPFATSPYVARVIGAEGLGTYSYSYSVAYYFVLFSLLGIKNYGNRAIAQARENQDNLNITFSNICSIHILISVFCCIAYIGYVFFLQKDQAYALIQGLYVLSGLFDISWFYFGIEKFKLTVTRNIIIKLINVGCIFIFVKNAEDLWKYCFIMAAGQLISQLSLWIPLSKYVKFKKPTWEAMTPHIKPLFILFIPAIAVSLYKYMDKIMIGIMSSKSQLGFYENAEKVINISTTIISSFGTVMLPKMSNLEVNLNRSESTRYMKLSMIFVMCLAMSLSCGLAAVESIFAPVFWGSEFIESGQLIMGLAITIPFIAFANVIRTQYLIPKEKDKEYLISVIVGAVINVIINTLLISSLGAVGATIGTIVAEISVCLTQAYFVRNELPLLDYVRSFLFFVFLGLAMFGVVYNLGRFMGISVSTLIIQITTGIILYGILSLVYFVYTKNEVVMRILRKLIHV